MPRLPHGAARSTAGAPLLLKPFALPYPALQLLPASFESPVNCVGLLAAEGQRAGADWDQSWAGSVLLVQLEYLF